MLVDQFGRVHSYLRLAITDKCNLRCQYCIPYEKHTFLPKEELLSYEELLRITGIFVQLGVNKVRLTGGEPFMRKDCMAFIRKIRSIYPDVALHITTNGTLIAPHCQELADLGIQGVNLSCDSLDPVTYQKITRRDDFFKVWETMELLLEKKIPLKLNAVCQEDTTPENFFAFVQLADVYDLEARFIEQMPFNGVKELQKGGGHWNAMAIQQVLEKQFGRLNPVPVERGSAPAETFQLAGKKGKIGIIAAWTRSFCGSCDRIRINSTGNLMTCLYAHSSLNVRDMMRAGNTDLMIIGKLQEAFSQKAKDGFAAEALRMDKVLPYMTQIGG